VVTPTIRSARPEDAGFIARNILSAQRGPRPRGWFDIALGWPEPQCLAFMERLATAKHQSWWHTSQFIVAEVDEAPAAALCALPAAGTRAAARAAIAEVAGETGLDASETAAISRRGAYAANCWVQGGDSDWLIEHVAALPLHRSRGLVQALIGHALAAGKAAVCAGIDYVPDRQRAGRAMLCQGRLRLCRRETRSGLRSTDRRARLSPICARDLVRHCEPTGRANARPMTGSAKQSRAPI
jgi:hypothetical protein